jgi:transcriptional regulator with XRE-family HTH domain
MSQKAGLNQFALMVKKKCREKNLSQAEVALQARVSSKTINQILNNRWKAEETVQWRRAFPKVISKLASVLEFDAVEWSELLGFDLVPTPEPTSFSVEDLEYLIGVTKELKKPLPLRMAIDLVKLRR